MADITASRPDASRPRRRLFWKYVAVIVALVTTLLVASGGVELWFSYQESRDGLVGLQREKAAAAAGRIEVFIREIERQMGWTTLPLIAPDDAALEQRKMDFVRLQRQVQAITDLQYLDPEGKEQLRISRLSMDVVASRADLSNDVRFTEARARRKACDREPSPSACASIAYHGPVYFRKESEPYMVMSMAQSGGGVTVAEVNLKFIWDVVTQIKIGKAGRAYVIDDTGTLIAHSDISLVLQKTSLSSLPQVRDALAGNPRPAPTALDVQGRRVLTAHAMIPGLRWTVFAEQPLEEAFAPLEASLKRSLVLIAIGVSLAIGASLILARRMVRPIQALQAGAARIGGGELGHRIDVRTGDELQALAAEFNRMTSTLQESYATLEQRVVDRTKELTDALRRQGATAEILRVISSSPTDVQPVFDAIVASAVQLCHAERALAYRFDGTLQHFVAQSNASEEGLALLRARYPRPPERRTATGVAILDRTIVHVPDYTLDDRFFGSIRALEPSRDPVARSVLVVPMLREGESVGAILIRRGTDSPHPFTETEIELLQTFADQAVIAIENVRLFTELETKNAALTESLEQQTATAEILRVISSSPTDIQPVLTAVAESSARLCEATDGVIQLRDADDHLRIAAHFGSIPAAIGTRRPIAGDWVAGRCVLEARAIHVHDLQAEEAEYPRGSQIARAAGHRSLLAMPLLREGEAVGVIQIRRTEVRPFAEKHLTLLRTFADQAVIAIENVRLFNELASKNAALTESLEQQTATSEILRVISSSPTDTQPVFDTIMRNAVRLSGAAWGTVFRVEAGFIDMVAHENLSEDQVGRVRRLWPRSVDDVGPVPRTAMTGQVIRIADVHAGDHEFRPETLAEFRARDVRSLVVVPMSRHGQVIGSINLTHEAVGAFSDAHVALIRTFADQAVIAIENVRLFKELESRNAALTESLEQQTASAEILRIISSSPTDVRPVLDGVASAARRLCDADAGIVMREGDEIVVVAHDGPLGSSIGARRPLDRGSVMGRAIIDARSVHLRSREDFDPSEFPLGRDLADRYGLETALSTPMLRDGVAIGSINLRRSVKGGFTSRQIELIETFAAQAVIAIENVRLFTELQQRNTQVTEALEQQTATAEILSVISSSPTDLAPIFDAVLSKATSLCGAHLGALGLYDGVDYRHVANLGASPEFARYLLGGPYRYDETTAVGRIVRTLRPVHITDLMDEPAYRSGNPARMATVTLGGARTFLAVPMLKEGRLVGGIFIYRREVNPFTDEQIALVQTFANQAVIAIENVRLFKELEARNAEVTEALEQQTATAEILRVINAAQVDLQPVFEAIAASAARLCDGLTGGVFLVEGGRVVPAAHFNLPSEAFEGVFPAPLDSDLLTARAIADRRVVHTPDILEEPDYRHRGLAERLGFRGALSVPMMRDGVPIGAIIVTRAQPGRFSDKQIALLQTFADQAVIAIENVRLLQEVQARNAALTESLEQQTATSEILRSISGATMDAQPVFETIVRNAVTLCEGRYGAVYRWDGSRVHVVAYANIHERLADWLDQFPRELRPREQPDLLRLVIESGELVRIDDAETDARVPAVGVARRAGVRSMLFVPMRREETVLGVIAVNHSKPAAFTEARVELLKTFADQAVIAIENVRLFTELEQRNAEVTEALSQQTATGEVLRVIASSPRDVQPVFETIVQSAGRLCHADFAIVIRRIGAQVEMVATSRATPAWLERARRIYPASVESRTSIGSTCVREGRVLHVADVLDDTRYPGAAALARDGGYRSVLFVPMMQGDSAIGAIGLGSAEAFTEGQIGLMQTFADQAVIAIENVRLFTELQERTQQLQVANRHKDEFLANMSHELRTPLNAIIGFSEVMLEKMSGDLTDKQEEYLNDILSSGRHLLSLINDILDLSKIEAGRMELELTEFNLPVAIDNALTLVHERAARRGLTLTQDVDEALGDFRGDERKIKQVLLNLLSNAIKFTHEGGKVEVRAHLKGDVVEIAVTDTGIGIAPGDQELVFEEFRQVGSDLAKRHEGTGLGLALARRFVELHGGNLWLESEVGVGSTFTFDLPVRG